MVRFRRSSPEVRFEMTPLIDVVFLLLTFFIFALVLMVRANVLDVKLPEVGSGPAAEGITVTIAIDRENHLFVDGEPAEEETLVEKIQSAMADSPDARLVIAADQASASGVLIRLADMLGREGLGEFSIIGTEPTPTAADPE
jgi:biopolymer transport protein ExbD